MSEQPTPRPPENRPLEGCWVLIVCASGLAFFFGLPTTDEQPVVGVLICGFAAVVLILGLLGFLLARIYDRIDLLSDESRRRAEDAWRAEKQRKEQERRDYYRGLGYGLAKQTRAEQIRQAHLAEIRRGRWRRRGVWVRSVPGRFDAALCRVVGEENRILLNFLYGVAGALILVAIGLVCWMVWA